MIHYGLASSHFVTHCIIYCLVPFCMASKDQVFKVPADHNATLSNVAPTILQLMGVDKPVDMTGISLI